MSDFDDDNLPEFITGDERKVDVLTEFAKSPGSNMGYIKFNDNNIATTVPFLDIDLVLDYDADNRLVGIEFLDSERMPELSGDGSEKFEDP